MEEMKAVTAALLVFLIATAAGAELPAGTEIQIRLENGVASDKSKPGEIIQAVVIAPALASGQIAVPGGSKLRGKVREAQASRDGVARARVAMEFGELLGAGAKAIPIEAKVVAVDNAREAVDETGQIWGILASETLSAQMDKGLEKLGERFSKLAELLQAAKSAILNPAEVEVVYEPGAELTLQLTKSAQVNGMAGVNGAGVTTISGEAELIRLVNAQPFRTVAEKPPQPSDITNLMFIGSRERLEATFAAAGWKTAAALNAGSALETFRAIAENRGYHEAPVSTLLLEGKKPDLVFQKQNNTFAKRHHLRIWMRPQGFQGQSVWVAAATHDIGIEFSPESRTFIHKIDSRIDRERAKVVGDLVVTGQVKALALVERPEAPRESQNATGDRLETDGGMAVVVVGDKN